MAYSSKPNISPKLYDTTSSSFHKIYSEDYFSDEETVSMISRQLNSSCASVRSFPSNASPSPLMHANNASARLARSPLTSSAFSLHHLPHAQYSLNASFRSCGGERNHTLRPTIATAMTMPAMPRQNLFSSNLELNSGGGRPASSAFSMNSSLANSTLLNNSFAEGNKSDFTHNTQDNNGSFYAAANNSANNSLFAKSNHTFVAPNSHSELHSPLSVSSSALFSNQQLRKVNTHHNLLSPTRFSTNNFTSSNSSWLSGGYFNQRQTMTDMPRTGLIIPPIQNPSLATPMDECMSRSSSHSSGFESQNGRLNGNTSRENSLCPEFGFDQHHHRALTTDNINTFQPIDSPNLSIFSARSSVLPNPCLNNYPIENTGIWKQPAFTYRSNNSTNFTRNSVDSFNLRKINEELPAIKRGDFLQNWKEGQTIL